MPAKRWNFSEALSRCKESGRCLSGPLDAGDGGDGGPVGGGNGGVEGPQYFLDPANGLDSNPGTLELPWKTLEKVMTAANPGDTINVRGNAPGTKYTLPQFWAATSAKPFPIWSAESGHKKGLPGKPILIRARPGESVTFDGLGGSNWIRFVATPLQSRDFYVILRGFTFVNYIQPVISLWRGTRSIVIDDCAFVDIQAHESRAVIDLLSVSDVIVRHNRFYNVGRGPPLTTTGTMVITPGTHRLVIDENDFRGVGNYGLQFYASAATEPTDGVLVRKNTFVNLRSPDVLLSTTTYSDMMFYNNTMYSKEAPFPLADAQNHPSNFSISVGEARLNNVAIKNNIFVGYLLNSHLDFRVVPAFTSIVSNRNIWLNTRVPGRFLNYPGDAGVVWLDATAYQMASGDDLDSLVVDPKFVDVDAGDFGLADDSMAIDKGEPFTRAVGAGSGQVVNVVDTRPFSDGMGLIPGDLIQIGSARARIESIDRNNNRLILDRAVTWSDGLAVSLPYNGANPDLGSHEHP